MVLDCIWRNKHVIIFPIKYDLIWTSYLPKLAITLRIIEHSEFIDTHHLHLVVKINYSFLDTSLDMYLPSKIEL